jgi:hypothetical protein
MQTERDKRNPKGKVRKGQILLYVIQRALGKGDGMQMISIVSLSVLCWAVGGQPKELPAQPAEEFFPLKATDQEKTASFKRGQPVVGTTYFYWYDVESKAHIVNSDGSDALTTHPADMAGVSYKRAAWHKAQLRDMIDAGIDFLMPVYWGVPGKRDGWSFVGLLPLVEAHTTLEKEGLRPPAIGLFYDTSILQWNGSNTDGSNYHVDLTTEFGRQWFYAAIRDFFSLIPSAKWARIDGRPIIFLYEAAFVKKQDPQRQFEYVKTRFKEDFGVGAFPRQVRRLGGRDGRHVLLGRGGQRADPVPGCRGVGAGLRPQRGAGSPAARRPA